MLEAAFLFRREWTVANTSYTFTVLYEHDPETGAICATVPVLDLATYGQTLDEARTMMREALELHLEGMTEENLPLPGDVLCVEPMTVEVNQPTPERASS
jgi:predicted RNase H-like HicB family nuclease